MPEMLARYEFKYLIDPGLIGPIRDWTRLFCEPDAYGKDGQYVVSSVYFDTVDWVLARQTLEGVRNRLKLRMRTYGFTETDPVFCEIKGRVGTSIVKARALIGRHLARGIARNDPPPPDGFVALKPSHQPDLDRYRFLMDRLDLRPRVWVRYDREAYGSRYGDGARLTFDTALRVQPASQEYPFEPELDPSSWLGVPLDGPPCILEMKFNGAFPGWMLRIVQAFKLQRQSVSKYVGGAVLCGHLPQMALERGERWTAF